MGFFNNLLELSHAETQAAQAQIVEVFERITDGFVALDKEWRYTYINRRGAEFFGRRPEELIGKHIWTEFPEGVESAEQHRFLQRHGCDAMQGYFFSRSLPAEELTLLLANGSPLPAKQ